MPAMFIACAPPVPVTFDSILAADSTGAGNRGRTRRPTLETVPEKGCFLTAVQQGIENLGLENLAPGDKTTGPPPILSETLAAPPAFLRSTSAQTADTLLTYKSSTSNRLEPEPTFHGSTSAQNIRTINSAASATQSKGTRTPKQHAKSNRIQKLKIEKPLPVSPGSPQTPPPPLPPKYPAQILDLKPSNLIDRPRPTPRTSGSAPKIRKPGPRSVDMSRTGESLKPPQQITFSEPFKTMSRTMESSASSANPLYAAQASRYNNSSAYNSDVNGSQSSFASSSKYMSQDEDDTRDRNTPKSTGPLSAGPSPAVNQARTSSRATEVSQTPNASSQHLSGLMCNVHRTTGREPHPLVGATTTILGDKLYVFGGRILSRTKPQLTADLYELDLIRRHWTKLETSGDIPPPRYFHSVCALGDTKLVCYGGMSPAATPGQGSSSNLQNGPDAQPEVVVMSDIYIYDAPTRTWQYIPTQDTPQGRYAHCATVLPSSAVFSSANAALSAIHHNPSSANPNQGSIGVNIDGTGGAEMVIVGGQDSSNHYIEQISVFNLRSLKWTSTEMLGKSCGAYRSVVAPLPGVLSSKIGQASPRGQSNAGMSQEAKEPGSSMLIYSNYNFLDVKLELQIRSPDGTLVERPMHGTFSPPGLRFPNGGVIDTNFVVSGTYLTSSKQEYALWALDLRTLTWSRIDAGGSVFSQGSWNRGVLWNRRNTFVILGNRKRSLVEDYNHRRINFSNVCMVELEAFGLYDNPRKATPMSSYVSASSPFDGLGLMGGLSTNIKAGWCAGGRSGTKASEDLGVKALGAKELCDMDILAVGGERIPINSRVISRRWGPYFVQLLREGAATQEGTDTATLRPGAHHPSRNSSITITPSIGQSSTTSASTLVASTSNGNGFDAPIDPATLLNPPDAAQLSPSSRPRTLYLPHTHLTLQSLLYFLYTSTLPPPSSPLCTPQILCSLLQLARPYKIDGLLEAVVERLHAVLESRNAAAVFNAGAMAAGGGRATSSPLNALTSARFGKNTNGNGSNGAAGSESTHVGELASRTAQSLRINTNFQTNLGSGMARRANERAGEKESDDEEALSAVSSVDGSDVSGTGSESASASAASSKAGDGVGGSGRREIWQGEVSAVIGLQKRGLRGLMEGRRLRERGQSVGGPGGSTSH